MKLSTKFLLSVGLLALSATAAHAVSASSTTPAAGRDAFLSVWTTIKAWTEGTLGKVIALTLVLVGVGSGIARQNLMGFVVGVAGGVGLYNAPTIIDSVMGLSALNETLTQVSNYSFWAGF